MAIDLSEARRPAIVVMAKVPGDADVKTRLSPLLSGEDRASLATCFLQDTLRKCSSVLDDVIVAFAPEAAGTTLESLLGRRYATLAQKGDGLGARLAHAVEHAFGLGFGPVVVVGTDSPTFPSMFIDEALKHLTGRKNSFALGPTDDGGYYLVGVSAPQTSIFDNVDWSSDRVYAQTVANIRRIENAELLELPQWHDVDEPRDMLRLEADISADADVRSRAKATAKWIEQHQDVLGRSRSAG